MATISEHFGGTQPEILRDWSAGSVAMAGMSALRVRWDMGLPERLRSMRPFKFSRAGASATQPLLPSELSETLREVRPVKAGSTCNMRQKRCKRVTESILESGWFRLILRTTNE